jgi:hypothetical protein
MDLIAYHTDSKSSPDRISALLQIGSHMTPYPFLQAELNYKIATIIFNEAVSMQDGGAWSKSKGTLGSMEKYLSEALQLCDAATKCNTKEVAVIHSIFFI